MEVASSLSPLPERIEAGRLFENLLIAHKQYLDGFPSEGEEYFQLPEVSGELQEKYDMMTDVQVEGLVDLWLSSDLWERYKGVYGYRTIGGLLRLLVTRKGEQVRGCFERVCDRESISIEKFQRMMELILTSVENEDYFVTEVDADPEALFSYQKAQGARVRASLNLFKAGIKTDDFEKLYEDGLLVHHVDGDFLPALRAVKDWVSKSEGVDDEDLMLVYRDLLAAQVRATGKPEEATLEAIMAIDKKAAVGLLCYLYADKGENQVPDSIQRLLQEGEIFSPEEVSELLRMAMVEGRSVQADSFLVRQLGLGGWEKEGLEQVVAVALECTSGDWEKLDPSVRVLIEQGLEKAEFTGDGLGKILSACVGFETKLPAFLEKHFMTQAGQESLKTALLEWGFDFRKSGGVDIYGANIEYLFSENQWKGWPAEKFLLAGLSCLPASVRVAVGGIGGPLPAEFANSLLETIFGWRGFFFAFGRRESMVSPDDYVGHYYDLVSEDVWSLLGRTEIEGFADYFAMHPGLVKKGVGLFVHSGGGGPPEDVADRPITEFLPPSLVAALGRKVFPKGEVSEAALRRLKPLPFILNDELVEEMPVADQNFLRFYREFPKAAEKLFFGKTIFFTERKEPWEYVEYNLVVSLTGADAYDEVKVWADPRIVEELKFAAEHVGQPQRVFYPGCGTDRSPADAFGADRVLFMDIDEKTVSALWEAGLGVVCQDATTAEGEFDMVILFSPGFEARLVAERVKPGGFILANNDHQSAAQIAEMDNFEFAGRVFRDPESGKVVLENDWEKEKLTANVDDTWIFRRKEIESA